MGDMLKLMQGGQDRTGMADMADQYSFTPRARPEKSLEEILAGLQADNDEMGGEESGDETGGFDFGGALDYIGEKGSNVKDFLEENFGEYVPENIANMSGEDIEKDEELTSLFGEMKIDGNRALKNVSTPKVASTGVPKTGTVSMPVDDLKSSSFNPMSILKFLGKRSAPGAILMPTDLGAADFPIDEETGMPIYPDEFGMADGGRVEMQQGGMPGGMAMPGLLGVASGSSGNLFDNYTPNPSAVPGPNYGPPLGRPPMQGDPGYNPTPGLGYMQPELMDFQPSPMQSANYDVANYLGGPDPYAVAYNPYVDMGGSAYDNYGLGMKQEDIDKVFADTDKFSLAAQEAKRKAAEAAAAAAKKKQNTGGGHAGEGGGGSSGGGGKSCFVEGTPVEMADGTTKEITNIKVGDETRGGIVEVTMQCLPARIYNYKDVLVSGSHWVIEDNQFVAVEDSKHGVITDRIEPVYTLKTSKNRIWIYGIEFGDFETGSDEDWEPHFEAVRQKLNKQLDEKTY